MPTRLRKLIGSFGVIAFLIAYGALMATLIERLPDLFWLRTAAFVVAGLLWGAPLIPLIRWMNGSPRTDEASSGE